MGLDAEIMKAMNREAEAEAAEAAGSNPTPELMKESWKKVAMMASWEFTKTKGLPAFKSACKFTYAQAKALGKRPTAPGTKKVKDLRAQDVTVFGTVVDAQTSVTDKNMMRVSFIADGGTDVKSLNKNDKMIVMERGKIRA